MRSIARLRAVVTSHARGLAGGPSRGQRSAAIANASWVGLLREVEVAEEADQRCEHAAPLVAKDLVELYHSATGRTSTAPPIRAAGTREASSIAASRSSAS